MSKHNKGNGIQIETENATTWILNKEFIPTGRIKRMRKGESICNGILRRIHGTSIVIPRNNPDMYEIMMLTQDTRWNRH